MKVSLRFEGGSDLARRLAQLPDAVGDRVLRAALRDGAEPMRDRMASLIKRGDEAPHAADHVVISTQRARGDSDEIAVAVGPAQDFYYWFFQEYGTSRHPAQPAMRPAFDSEAPRSLGLIRDRLWDALRARLGLGGGRGSGVGL